MDLGTRLITGSDGQAFPFDPGAFFLELLLTGGPEADQRWELLRGTADLAAWLVDSRLALTAPIDAEDVRIRPAELRDIKQFRDTLWTVAHVVAAAEEPNEDELEIINAAAESSLRPRIALDTGVCEWATPITGTQVLGTAAREAIDVIGGDRIDRLRECEAEDCALVFLDTSRPGNRRWCSMQRCGNRHKVKAYRARQAKE
ncbi:CGNR zinc finger domain-containing protein [Amycolatopsis sp. YIM 10]|uniref:CGNR zinc finger domain-containing protein n=1 Tax=Amycolatopsis sp. YIM 10 TaxID=2653857 RepID=UPI00128FEEA1|nr:CGNR zinc finger domain-containing protein [Amycolatopsis sp. YIM 10]QFU85239.1 CGNR zinc finger [Amycolatopsis sp. YIM 10]